MLKFWTSRTCVRINGVPYLLVSLYRNDFVEKSSQFSYCSQITTSSSSNRRSSPLANFSIARTRKPSDKLTFSIDSILLEKSTMFFLSISKYLGLEYKKWVCSCKKTNNLQSKICSLIFALIPSLYAVNFDLSYILNWSVLSIIVILLL